METAKVNFGFRISDCRFVIALLLCFAAAVGAKYSGGTGEPNNPYRIADHNDLYALADDANDYNKCFILTNDIDLNPNLAGRRTLTTALIAPDTNATSLFHQGARFTGTFDGNNCKILNLRINNGKDYLALFGFIAPNASVRNLGLENVNITATGYPVGALAGHAWDATVTKCYATGAVSGIFEVGGLMGIAESTSVTICYATNTISAGLFVGGLVGAAVIDTSVVDCYATGAVNGDGNCIGGLVGHILDSSVSNCYSAGAVSSGGNMVGGLVGYKINSTVANSFWDVNTSGKSFSFGGTGKTTIEMKTKSTFTDAGWDFIQTWDIGENQTYPFLRTYLAGDLNHDSKVDFYDFAVFASGWLEGI